MKKFFVMSWAVVRLITRNAFFPASMAAEGKLSFVFFVFFASTLLFLSLDRDGSSINKFILFIVNILQNSNFPKHLAVQGDVLHQVKGHDGPIGYCFRHRFLVFFFRCATLFFSSKAAREGK